MERICPFLALEDDARTAIAGYDPGHRCSAVRPAEPLERPQQLTTCLVSDHRSCPRYVAALEGVRARNAWSSPDEELALVSTRLVLGADGVGRGPRSMAGGRRSTARWGIGAAAAVVGVATVGSLSGAFAAPQGSGLAPSSDPAAPTISPLATPQPAIGEPSPRPAVTTPSPSASDAATPRPTRRATATPSAAPQAQTYVVQPGDTLAAIAVRFGTSVSALQAANDLADTDVILIGQVLVIP